MLVATVGMGDTFNCRTKKSLLCCFKIFDNKFFLRHARVNQAVDRSTCFYSEEMPYAIVFTPLSMKDEDQPRFLHANVRRRRGALSELILISSTIDAATTSSRSAELISASGWSVVHQWLNEIVLWLFSRDFGCFWSEKTFCSTRKCLLVSPWLRASVDQSGQSIRTETEWKVNSATNQR